MAAAASFTGFAPDDPARAGTEKALEALLPSYDTALASDSPRMVPAMLPGAAKIEEALRILLETILPGSGTTKAIPPAELPDFLRDRLQMAWKILFIEIRRALPFRWAGQAARTEGAVAPRNDDLHAETEAILTAFFGRLSEVRERVVDDVRAAYEGDPAALTYAEVLLAYPGLLAIAGHRIAHELFRLGVPILPRVMSEWIHTKTGADIHPGATIGRHFFMDHCTGIVIGETARIGECVKIYQGVTLGALSFPLGPDGNPVKHVRRHPTVESDVVIYANATILGGETVIGEGSTIGASVFLSESVPPHSYVVSRLPEADVRPKKA
jgi:serine O-acetyltransferase